MSDLQIPPDSEQQTPPTPGSKARRIEDIFILLCVASLWPVILGWDGLLYEAGLYIALAGLIFIFIRRVRRFRKASTAFDSQDD